MYGLHICRRLYCVFRFNFHFCRVIFSLFLYFILRVLISRKVVIYSDGDNIIIIIITVFFFFFFFFFGLRFKLVLLVLLWLSLYFVGSYPLAKC